MVQDFAHQAYWSEMWKFNRQEFIDDYRTALEVQIKERQRTDFLTAELLDFELQAILKFQDVDWSCRDGSNQDMMRIPIGYLGWTSLSS